MLSTLALTLLSPLFVVIGVVIRMTSRGPVFFRQTRVGLHGREFSIVKFRAMTALTGAESGIFRPGNTTRCTWIGGILRASKIDELPQFWNVLKGEMSLVGPRPEVLLARDPFMSSFISCCLPRQSFQRDLFGLYRRPLDYHST